LERLPESNLDENTTFPNEVVVCWGFRWISDCSAGFSVFAGSWYSSFWGELWFLVELALEAEMGSDLLRGGDDGGDMVELRTSI